MADEGQPQFGQHHPAKVCFRISQPPFPRAFGVMGYAVVAVTGSALKVGVDAKGDMTG